MTRRAASSTTQTCSICGDPEYPRIVHHPDGCPYRKKSDPVSSVVEIRRIFGRFGYWVYDGAAVIEHFDDWRNAMRFAKRFAKALNKGPVVRYVQGSV